MPVTMEKGFRRRQAESEAGAMALIRCPECGASVSDQSSICIQCGYPLRVSPTIVQMNTKGLARWKVSCSNGEAYTAGGRAVMQFHITNTSRLTWRHDLEEHSDYIEPGGRYMITTQPGFFGSTILVKQ